MEHSIDTICSCEVCTKIDTLWGDPLLNKWEYAFIKDVADFGWRDDYSEKQIAKINQIFEKQKRR